MNRKHIKELRTIIEQGSAFLNDETALEAVELFPNWRTDHEYQLNDRVQYSEVLYKCVQAHTSQASWTPDLTPALWARVSVDEYPDWIQPTGVQDAYNTGDKVSHNGQHWISIVDSNVWEPGVYGWEEVNG